MLLGMWMVMVVETTTTLRDTLIEMTQKGLGMTVVTDNGQLAGIFTDGDLRRVFDEYKNIDQVTVGSAMSLDPITISGSSLAAEALGPENVVFAAAALFAGAVLAILLLGTEWIFRDTVKVKRKPDVETQSKVLNGYSGLIALT